MLKAIKRSLSIIIRVDKKCLLYCILYNLIKQLMNVFYGVYFLRLILENLETSKNIIYILSVLLLMLIINILFTKFDQFYNNIYLQEFELKLQGYVNEIINIRANSISYDNYNTPDELDKYSRVIDNSSTKIIEIMKVVGTLCGLIEAFALILYYIVHVDIFAILLSIFPLLYSYFLGERSEKLKYELSQKITSNGRKKEYARRVFYLPEYAKELRLTGISSTIKKIYHNGVRNTIQLYKKEGVKISLLDFTELFLGDLLSVILPIVYVVIRMLNGIHFALGDFIGISQAITIFSWDIEWFLDETLKIKSASYYINEFIEYSDDNKLGVIDRTQVLNNTDVFSVELKNVKYKYPGSEQGDCAINGISLEIHNGEKIAIVGENGAGKSTLAYLLMNLIQCTEGEILLNGININQYKKSELIHFFGTVLQDYQLYPLSVRENVAVLDDIDDRKIHMALNAVELDEQVQDLDCIIGKELADNGIELSGGQRQKLAVTRIIANNYPFVILDEPTSALDAISERQIYSLILDALKNSNKTLLFISHKMATTRLVDRIIVLKHGMIVEEGNHQQLMNMKGMYYNMYTEQMNMYKGLGEFE